MDIITSILKGIGFLTVVTVFFTDAIHDERKT